MYGGGDNDLLFGEGGADSLRVQGGNDTLNGGLEDDTYLFEGDSGHDEGDDTIADVGGKDKLDFGEFSDGITVDLAITSRQTIREGVLTLQMPNSIEDVVGTDHDDIIRGNVRANNLLGRGAHDVLEGRAGNDTLLGGAGNDHYIFAGNNLGVDSITEAAMMKTDTLDFSGMPLGVQVDISKFGNRLAVDSIALKLTLSNNTAIENVRGTAFQDQIIGNVRNNWLYGLGDKDVIKGGVGNDHVDGGSGGDYLYGGEGDDQLIVDSNDQAYGQLGRDWFDEYREGISFPNPHPDRFRDWGTI